MNEPKFALHQRVVVAAGPLQGETGHVVTFWAHSAEARVKHFGYAVRLDRGPEVRLREEDLEAAS